MLHFAPLTDAFRLGSDQIKDTQNEIARLSKMINDSKVSKGYQKETNNVVSREIVKKETMKNADESSLGDSDILKVIQHPKFDEIVQNYLIVKKPEWLYKKEQSSTFSKSNFANIQQGYTKQQAYTKEKFGNVSTQNVNPKHCLIFFVLTIVLYIYLKHLFA
jgi:hypothetical protein